MKNPDEKYQYLTGAIVHHENYEEWWYFTYITPRQDLPPSHCHHCHQPEEGSRNSVLLEWERVDIRDKRARHILSRPHQEGGQYILYRSIMRSKICRNFSRKLAEDVWEERMETQPMRVSPTVEFTDDELQDVATTCQKCQKMQEKWNHVQLFQM
jgi:hypothetical protein